MGYYFNHPIQVQRKAIGWSLKAGSQYDARRRVAMRRPRVDACHNARIDLNPILAFPCDTFTRLIVKKFAGSSIFSLVTTLTQRNARPCVIL